MSAKKRPQPQHAKRLRRPSSVSAARKPLESQPPQEQPNGKQSPEAGVWTTTDAKLFGHTMRKLIKGRNRQIKKDACGLIGKGGPPFVYWMHMQIRHLEGTFEKDYQDGSVGEAHRVASEILSRRGQKETPIQAIYDNAVRPVMRGRFNFIEDGFRAGLAAKGMNEQDAPIARDMLERAKTRIEEHWRCDTEEKALYSQYDSLRATALLSEESSAAKESVQSPNGATKRARRRREPQPISDYDKFASERKSLSKDRAAFWFGKSTKSIQNLFSSGRLTRTHGGRVLLDEKFKNEHSAYFTAPTK